MGYIFDCIGNKKLLLWYLSGLGLISTTYLIFGTTHLVVMYYILFFLVGFSASGYMLAFSTLSHNTPDKYRGIILSIANSILMGFSFVLPTAIGYMIESNALIHIKLAFSIIPLSYIFTMIMLFLCPDVFNLLKYTDQDMTTT